MTRTALVVALVATGVPLLVGQTPASGLTAANPALRVQTIAADSYDNVMLSANGTPYGAGLNGDGQLTGTGETALTLSRLSGLPTGVHGVQISAGGDATLVLGSNGVAYGTGNDQYSKLTNNTESSMDTLTPLKGLPKGVYATQVSEALQSSLVLGSNGIAYGDGLNSEGQLTGSVFEPPTLIPLTGLPGGVKAVAVAAGWYHSLVLGKNGVVYGTGDNSSDQLTGFSSSYTTLTPLSGLPSGVKATTIAAGEYTSLVIGSNGIPYGAGRNSADQLTTNAASPADQLTALSGLPNGVRATGVSAGPNASVVLGSDGQVYGTGTDDDNDLATGGPQLETLTPLTHSIPDDVTQVSIGVYDVVVRDAEGVVYGSGDNTEGQLTTNAPSGSQTTGFVVLAGQRLTELIRPSIAGIPRVGSRLYASPGGWLSAPTAYHYQWRANGTAIPGATAESYVPTSVTLGAKLTVSVVVERGGFVSGSAISPATTPVLRGAPLVFTHHPKPSISGTHTVGKKVQVLHLTKSGFTPTATALAYQWLRNKKAIDGARASSYQLRSVDRGTKISVRIIASRAGYQAGSVTTKAVFINH